MERIALAIIFASMAVPSPAAAQTITLEGGLAYYEKISADLKGRFDEIEDQIGDISEPKAFSLLNVIVDNIKGFRQVDLNSYKDMLLNYCDKLAARDDAINNQVAANPKTKAKGPTAEQAKEKETITELRSFCLAPGNGGRQVDYWTVYLSLDQRSDTLYQEFLRRRDICDANTRCRDGVSDG